MCLDKVTAKSIAWITVGVLLLAASVWLLVKQPGGRALRQISLEDLDNETFSASFKQFQWLHAANSSREDAAFAEVAARKVEKFTPNSEHGEILLALDDAQYPKETSKIVELAPDFANILVARSIKKSWRHSFDAEYEIFACRSQKTQKILLDGKDTVISAAKLVGTSGDNVAFVADNDLYLWRAPDDVKRISNTGSDTVRNGIADWVYEEEVLSTARAFWPTDDGAVIAYLALNNSDVPVASIPFFVEEHEENDLTEVKGYPSLKKFYYPKPGFANPVAELFVFDVQSGENTKLNLDKFMPPADRIVGEVVWLGKKLLVKLINRNASLMKTLLFATDSPDGILFKESKADPTSDWLEVSKSVTYIPGNDDYKWPDAFVDIEENNGFNHLVYYSLKDVKSKRFLTSGEWEVDKGPFKYIKSQDLLFFRSTQDSPAERQIFMKSVHNIDEAAKSLTESAAVYQAAISDDFQYFIASYRGPNLPYQTLHDAQKGVLIRTLEDNAALKGKLEGYKIPAIKWGQISVGNLTFSFQEIRPPGFKSRKKYPLLFYCYGGPGSQAVSKDFALGISSYLSSKLGIVVVTVDGRGTGFKGKAFRSPVKNKLGLIEAGDQISAAKVWAEKPYIDQKRMGIWGWSFGGYLTLKVLTNPHNPFQFGISVAPVVDWRLYDSIFTERFMMMPNDNRIGYMNSAVQNWPALSKVHRFMVVHGSGDDNVHVQNTMKLIDRLTVNKIRNFDVMLYTDSNHSINYHEARSALYYRMSEWLERTLNSL